MKNLTKLFVTAIVLLFFGAASFAQVTASASATATIITPIAIAKTVDMNFGNLYVSLATGGTVILTPAGVRSFTGNIGFPVLSGTITAASFTVTGLADATYSIALPAGSLTLTHSLGTATMIVDTWTSTPTVAAGGVLTAGTQTLNVGATLHVTAAQLTGVYVSLTPFDVTVNYN